MEGRMEGRMEGSDASWTMCTWRDKLSFAPLHRSLDRTTLLRAHAFVCRETKLGGRHRNNIVVAWKGRAFVSDSEAIAVKCSRAHGKKYESERRRLLKIL